MAKKESVQPAESETNDLLGRTMRFIGLAYAAVGLVLVYVVFVYFIIFLVNLGAQSSADGSATSATGAATAIDLCLIGLFGLQHSLMARSQFKTWWTRIVPAGLERSTYVHASNIALALSLWQWQPIPTVIWHVETEIGRAIIWVIFAAGWVILFAGSLMIDQFELLGLRQAWAWFQMRPYCENKQLQTGGLYGLVRHPMYVGIAIALWAAPHMSAGHLLLAAGLTIYILIGTYFEERDLVRTFGQRYRAYQLQVPKFIPSRPRRAR
jgi:protein-S-isoprenylcysteine O-methyltransferase Ste14